MSIWMPESADASDRPPFVCLQLVFKSVSVLSPTADKNVQQIAVRSGSTKAVVYDRSVQSLEWTDRKLVLNQGRVMVVDARNPELIVELETSRAKLKEAIKIGQLEANKTTTSVLTLHDPIAEGAHYEIECILLKKTLQFESKASERPPVAHTEVQTEVQTEVRVQSQSSSSSTQTEAIRRQRDFGVQADATRSLDASTSTADLKPANEHERQVLTRMVMLMVNRIYTRLREEQTLRRAQIPVASKSVGTDLVLPLDVKQHDVDELIQIEHVQALKDRLKSLTNKRKELEEPKPRKPTRRLCRELKQKQAEAPALKPPTARPTVKKLAKIAMAEFEDTVADIPTSSKAPVPPMERPTTRKERSESPLRKPPLLKPPAVPKPPPKTEFPPKPPASTAQPLSSSAAPKSSQQSEEASEESSTPASDDELTDESIDESEEEDTSAEESTEESEEESEESPSEDSSSVAQNKAPSGTGSSVQEEISENSTSSSVPTEIGSVAPSSRRSYLESVASSSQTMKNDDSSLSPTSAHLKKLRSDVLKNRV